MASYTVVKGEIVRTLKYSNDRVTLHFMSSGFQGGVLGSKTETTENPFLADDISGRQNRILNAVKDPTNVLIYRSEPPSIHIVGSESPSVLNINNRNLGMIPIIPNSIRALIIRDNNLKTLNPLSGHPSLVMIEASSNLIETVEFEENPPNLRALILASNSIHSIACKDFFRNLQVLNLSGNRLTEFNFGMFPSLKTLNLSCNSFMRFELNSASLLELSIQNNTLTEFIVLNARSLTHLDVSSNHLTDISVVEKLPCLTHLTAHGNKFVENWVSWAVTSAPTITHIDGRLLREGEIAIHKDRVARFIRTTKAPHPHQKISKIRGTFRCLKDVDVPAVDANPDDIESVWIGKSKERVSRAQIISDEAEKLQCVSTLSEDGCLTIYGTLKTSEFMETDFTTLKLQYVPITRGSDVEKRVMELGQKEPTMLTLDHNLLGTAEDLMFLTAFPSVTVLQIDGNPVMRGTLFRPLVSYLMPMLQVVNGQQITLAEKLAGIAHFKHLLVVAKNIEIETGLEEEEFNE